MKKIISIALLMTLTGAASMHGTKQFNDDGTPFGDNVAMLGMFKNRPFFKPFSPAVHAVAWGAGSLALGAASARLGLASYRCHRVVGWQLRSDIYTAPWVVGRVLTGVPSMISGLGSYLCGKKAVENYRKK